MIGQKQSKGSTTFYKKNDILEVHLIKHNFQVKLFLIAFLNNLRELEACNFIKKEALTQTFSCEFC